MRKVTCYECGKSYDFNEDAFCPRCGAFNQPPKSATINVNGEVERLDGLSEVSHAHSFVHQELHRENLQRRSAGLEQGSRPSRAENFSRRPDAKNRAEQKQARPAGFITWVVILIVIINFLIKLASH